MSNFNIYRLKGCLRIIKLINDNALLTQNRSLSWRLGYAMKWIEEAVQVSELEEASLSTKKTIILPELHNAVTIMDTVKPVVTPKIIDVEIVTKQSVKERVQKYLHKKS